MDSIPASLEKISASGIMPEQNSPFQSECLATALELHKALQEEADILRRFDGAELLWLIPKKEYLISELEWKLESARQTADGVFVAPDRLKRLLEEIAELNASNGNFIQKSISYWQDLLSIFVPPSYGPAGEPARSGPSSARGMAFKTEV